MIICVEDEPGIRDLMIYALNAAGFEASGVSSSQELFEEIKEVRPDLILLDIMLPGEDGIEILKKLRTRAQTMQIPIIMATAKGTEYDKVLALDLGADDYLAKPFGMMEMVSRVRAVLRRSQRTSSSSIIENGELRLNHLEHTVFLGEERIRLTLKEYELLKLFMLNPGRVFTREQLLESVWGHNYLGETRTVDVHIGTLRSKLDQSGQLIETVRGVGYRMRRRS